MYPTPPNSGEDTDTVVSSAPRVNVAPPEVNINNRSMVNITVAPFTGGPFQVNVNKTDTIEELRKVIARRLKVSKERIYLLYRESELVEGSVGTNLLVDGSTVTLLPRAETGLLSPKPEQSVMQALESLNEQQVNDFLSGQAPLNLTMRLGDHMMLIQLQLSTVNPVSASRRKPTIQISSSSPPFPTPPPSTPSSPTTSPTFSPTPSPTSAAPHPQKVRVPLLSPGGLYSAPSTSSSSSSSSSGMHSSQSTSSEHSRYRTQLGQHANRAQTDRQHADRQHTDRQHAERQHTDRQHTERTQTERQHADRQHTERTQPHSPTTTPVHSYREGSSDGSQPPTKKPKLDTAALAEASKNLTQTLKQLSSEVLTTKPEATVPKPKKEESSSSSSGSSSSSRQRKRRAADRDSKGAIIESMHHHGKGVYSGTFSGTLNPALQDRNGQPKRDISTIVHILNDLLCAQYKAYNGGSSSRSSKHGTREPSSKAGQSADGKNSEGFDASKEDEKQQVEDQLNITRNKVEQLRKIMEERRARRKARREARTAAPYSTQWTVSGQQPAHCDRQSESAEKDFLHPEPEPVTA